MIQRPAIFDPYHHPDRLKERRNIVLGLMRQNGQVSDRDYTLAIEAPLTVAMVIEFSNKFQRLYGRTWYQTLELAWGFASTLKPEDYVAVIAYSTVLSIYYLFIHRETRGWAIQDRARPL